MNVSRAFDPDSRRTYVLMTAARNEAANIEQTLRTVMNQTLRPQKWIIVSDGSADGTDEIVKAFAAQNDFIQFVRINGAASRSFASKGRALKIAEQRLRNYRFDYIGNVDADVSLPPSFYEDLIRRFEKNTRLGVAGGFVFEEQQGQFLSRKVNSIHSVPHAAQLIRADCYKQIGGYAVLQFGGEDWLAQTMAKMNGWHTEAFSDLAIFHLRPAAYRSLRTFIREGRMDYSFGSDPFFEVLKCLRHSKGTPLYCGGMVRLSSFLWAYIRRDQRPVPREVADFLQKEQRDRVRSLIGANASKMPDNAL